MEESQQKLTVQDSKRKAERSAGGGVGGTEVRKDEPRKRSTRRDQDSRDRTILSSQERTTPPRQGEDASGLYG